MSDLTARNAPKRRADAERSIGAILDAAVELLGDRPEASMSQIADAAGVSRQTVYAHYSTRDALLDAVARGALAETLDAIDAARPQDGPPAYALDRLIDAWWANVARHARVLETLGPPRGGAREIHDLHAPVLDRLLKLIRRGRRSGDFAAGPSPDWLAAAFLGLMHTAADEVAADRLTADAAGRELRSTIPRLFGVADASGYR